MEELRENKFKSIASTKTLYNDIDKDILKVKYIYLSLRVKLNTKRRSNKKIEKF